MNIVGLLLVLNFASTWYMVGLIWFVQLVHYPQFSQVGTNGFCEYHRRHTRFTTFAVGPAMLIEMASSVLLLVRRPEALPLWAAWTGIVLVSLLWLSTALVQVPKHNVLARGFNTHACRALVVTNWARTLFWSARGILMGWVLLRAVLQPLGG